MKPRLRAMGADIASANYQQEPIDLKGRLYTSFKTYSGQLPRVQGDTQLHRYGGYRWRITCAASTTA
ncbi:MAG: hypothetical protein ACLTBV_13760 [Enterocloster bolteae]